MKYYSFCFADLSDKDRGKLIKGSVIPRPIAWITTYNEDRSINLAPFSYFNMLNTSTMMVSFLRTGLGAGTVGPTGARVSTAGQKDTARNILRSGEAVVHIPSRSLIRQVDLSSAPLPYGESELLAANLTATPSRSVEVPGIAEAQIRLEVQLYQHLEIPFADGRLASLGADGVTTEFEVDKLAIESDLMILRVVAAHFSEEVYDPAKGYVLHEQLDPLARLGGPSYSGIDPVSDFERAF